MLHLGTVTNPASFVMFLACILGAAFMVCFLVALTLDEKKKMPAESARQPSGLHFPADMAWAGAGRETAVNSAAHLAIGVARITTVLASDQGGRKRKVPVGPLHVLKLVTPGRGLNFTTEHRYRSG